MTIAALSSGSEEIAPRKTAENTVKHRDGGVGSVVANHRDGSESSVVVTTVVITYDITSHLSHTYTSSHNLKENPDAKL